MDVTFNVDLTLIIIFLVIFIVSFLKQANK
jgi:hypothetical protein